MFKTSKIVFAIALVAITSLKAYATTKNPIQFNDALVSIVDQLYKNGMEWGKKFNHIDSTSRNFSELASLNNKLKLYIDEKIVELKTMEDVKGSEEFKKAMIEFLMFERNLITTTFVPFEKLNKSSTDKEIQKALDNLTTEAAKEKDALKKVQDAQTAYATKNNFSIRGAGHVNALCPKITHNNRMK